MNTLLLVGVLLLFALAVLGSAWYIAFRVRTTLGLQRKWLSRVLAMAALVGSFMMMGPAPKSADVVAGLSYLLGGYLFAGYVFLALAFVFLHAGGGGSTRRAPGPRRTLQGRGRHVHSRRCGVLSSRNNDVGKVFVFLPQDRKAPLPGIRCGAFSCPS